MLADLKSKLKINKNWYNILMSIKSSSQPDCNKPVAYDVDGRPLYAHPSVEQVPSGTTTQGVHLIRPSEPEKQIISEETELKHEESKKTWPECDLNSGEYIISVVSRHPVGLLLPIVMGVFLISLAFTMLFNFDFILQSLDLPAGTVDSSIILLPVLVFSGFVMLGTYTAYSVYTNNKLFLTNESIIQVIQTGVFSKNEKMVSLIDIEDVSYSQRGIIEHMFNFGMIRLSTEGEGTVYRFKFVANPKEVIATLKNAVESFKNGRAIV